MPARAATRRSGRHTATSRPETIALDQVSQASSVLNHNVDATTPQKGARAKASQSSKGKSQAVNGDLIRARKELQEPKSKDTSSNAEPISIAPPAVASKSASNRKRKRSTLETAVFDGPDELPHNLGESKLDAEIKQGESSSPGNIKAEQTEGLAIDGTNGRSRKADKINHDVPSARGSRRSMRPKIEATEDVKAKVEEMAEANEETKKPKKAKNAYGLSPGQSPFPDFKAPSPEACEEVKSLLETVHGKVSQPARIPAPSLTVSGCGEVPSILDALIRTLLSAATNNRNSSRAFQGLVSRFGILKDGVGKGSVDWNKVREADVSEVFEAIKSGGLAATKSKNIKKILDRVYEINIARRDALIKERDNGAHAGIRGADEETRAQKDAEIAMADANMLSLDYMHALAAEEAMSEFIKFPGIGVKTASCVLLFCMQRPSFAVDTHVYRLTQWLKWIPKGATRDQTFSHLETKIPDHLKYALHYLFIRHGRTCGRCRAITSPGTEEWKKANCPIEHLVTRTGRKAMAGGSTKGHAKNPTKKRKTGRGKGSSDESELSDTEISSFEGDESDYT